ncbi:hypothetical protein FPZ12_041570 [Amycolatopsis acidicola]|uniref:Alpha/beta hydrolase n=1 Tax=Amycolatopsis acidicola TaxID=2596893 RepID=A0A5N0UMP7_9PSEU|nr:hypothetical protein [Amycolatopsis acidicola]KAA9150266.1 hypothetical protein FPZ12_041570 [Amycolatopsis acidicola]
MNHSADPVRARGPSAVTEGTPDGPIVLVLDPAGAAPREGLPATWRDLGESLRIVWCRLPADGGLSEADDLLADKPGKVAHLVASGPYAETALRLAEQYPESVRSVLLVDPGTHGFVPAGEGPEADADWELATRTRRWALTRSGVEVHTVAHSEGGERDRVPAPLPLGHPDVAEAVRKFVAELD